MHHDLRQVPLQQLPQYVLFGQATACYDTKYLELKATHINSARVLLVANH